MNTKNIHKTSLKKQKKARGFSLIELLVTVGIIGVLASVAVPAYNKYRENAALGASKSEGSNFRKALEACLATGNDISKCADEDIDGVLKPPCGAATWTAAQKANDVITEIGTLEGNSKHPCHWHYDSTNRVACYSSYKKAGGFVAAYCISYNGGNDQVSETNASEEGSSNVTAGICKTDGTCL